MKILKLRIISMLNLVQNSLEVFQSGKEFEQEATAGVYYFQFLSFGFCLDKRLTDILNLHGPAVGDDLGRG
jgi:hypothetical protein